MTKNNGHRLTIALLIYYTGR